MSFSVTSFYCNCCNLSLVRVTIASPRDPSSFHCSWSSGMCGGFCSSSSLSVDCCTQQHALLLSLIVHLFTCRGSPSDLHRVFRRARYFLLHSPILVCLSRLHWRVIKTSPNHYGLTSPLLRNPNSSKLALASSDKVRFLHSFSSRRMGLLWISHCFHQPPCHFSVAHDRCRNHTYPWSWF